MLVGLANIGVDGWNHWTAKSVSGETGWCEEGSASGACGKAEGHGGEVDV
jgi:hypothetical protein